MTYTEELEAKHKEMGLIRNTAWYPLRYTNEQKEELARCILGTYWFIERGHGWKVENFDQKWHPSNWKPWLIAWLCRTRDTLLFIRNPYRN
jgi:hypothetical protein